MTASDVALIARLVLRLEALERDVAQLKQPKKPEPLKLPEKTKAA